MKKICLSKLQFLLLALLLTALAGCGANNAGTANNAGNGVAKAALVYGTKGTAKATAALVAVPTNIASVQFTVTGSGPNGALPVVKNVVTTTGGSVSGIYPGTVTLAARAFDSTGAVVYEGFALNSVITAGTTTDVGTIYMTAPIVKAAEAGCLGCHDNTLDATGQNIVGGYKQSGHYSNTSFQDISSATMPFFNKVGTGCVGCHGPQHNVGNPSALASGRSGVVATSVGSARCFDCHNANAGNVSNHDGYYVVNGTVCTACHQVHDTAAANMERLSWATSRHGATDFANIAGGVSGCATRCHNAKGFIAAVANPSAIIGGSMTPAPQMVTCDACHTNAALGVLRNIPGAKAGVFQAYTTSTMGYQFAPYNNLNPNKKKYYPDVAGSNLCIICHSGTTEGSATSLGCSDPYFVNSPTAIGLKKSSTITQHNMPAAAVMYVKFGFTNLSTTTTPATTAAYVNSLTSDLDAAPGTAGVITSTHRKFGTTAIISDSHFSPSNPAPANFLANGPCAVCHVSGSHTYKIDQAAITAVCNHCHTAENGNSITTEDSFKTFFLDPQQEVYRNAIQLGATVVNQKVALYNAALTSTPNALGYSTTNPLKFMIAIDPMTSTQPGKLVVLKYMLDGSNGTSNTPYAADGTILVSSSSSTSSTYAAPGSANANYLAPAATTSPYYSTDYTNAAIALGYSTVAGDAGYTKFMGAISNLAFFAKDNGGFAHARTYSRRLIYDSIDFLDDGVLNLSVGNTAKATSLLANIGGAVNPVAGLYTKAATAYNTGGTPVAITIPTPATSTVPATSESMLYIIGWNRTTGAWTVPERP